MRRINQYLPTLVLIFGIVIVIMGAVFIAQGVEKENWVKGAMQIEKVTLGLSEEQIAQGEVIDTAEEAQASGDTIREHRRGIAATYGELLDGRRFDPTNFEQLSYAQALNMENYLYLAVLSFGVTMMIKITGITIIIIGIALGTTGIAMRGTARE